MPLVPIIMPQLGESIAEATVIALLVEPGQTIDVDQDVIEVETQKATMTVTTLCSGVVREFRAVAGETYPVGHVLGVIEATAEEAARSGVQTLDGGDSAAEETESGSGANPNPPAEADSAAAGPSEAPKAHFADIEDAAPPSAEPDQAAGVTPNVAGLPVPVHAKGASYISPRLKVRMEELGLRAADLANVTGSGRSGRVTVDDLDRFLAYLEKYPSHDASPMRRAVADSMHRSWSRPLATVGLRLRMQPLLDHRRAQDPKPGVTLYAIRALALALVEFPAAAGHLIGKKIFKPTQIDIGFAIEVPDGVLVPKLRAVEQRSLADLVGDYQRLLEAGQNRRLTEEDQRGGIATITNIGTFNLVWGTPIPPPTESLTLALCAAEVRPRWNAETGQFDPSLEAELCLSFDHRVIDGGAAGRLMERVRAHLEDPASL